MSGYIGRAPVPKASRYVKTLTLQGGETEIPFKYTPGALDVYYNGILLSTQDVIATDGNTLQLVEPATAGAELTLVSLSTFAVADAYTKAEADERFTTQQALSQTVSNPNLLINGDFDVWQRGDSFTPTEAYTADRWFAYGPYNYCTITKVPEEGDFESPKPLSRNILRWEQTTTSTASGNACHLIQRIEDGGALLRGRTVTLSFWAKADKEIALKVIREYKSSISSTISTTRGTVNVTTTWQKFKVTFNISMFDNPYDGVIAVGFEGPLNETYVLDLSRVKLEYGEEATEFVPRLIAEELALCQRYYEVIDASSKQYSIVATGYADNVNVTLCCVQSYRFSTPKRIIPAFRIIGDFSTYNVEQPEIVGTKDLFTLKATSTGTGRTFFSLNSDSYIEADAEL